MLTNFELAEGVAFADRYKIKRLLGDGGMGKVYLAEDLILENELVALKILREDLCRDEKHIKRFIREVQLTRKVAHPNVVRTHDIAWNEGIIYFTMEVVEGITLKDRLLAGKIELSEIIQILLQITKGLSSIHECGIIHRDLKPGNIIISQSGVVKIADFGIARPSFTDLTQQNEVVGSAGYMAPEVWTGGDIDARSDIYSLGVLMYELIVGSLPFDGGSATEVMNRHMTYTPQKLDVVDDRIPSWLAEIIAQMLEKNPNERPSSAKDICSIIEVGSKQNHLAPKGKTHSLDTEVAHETRDHTRKEPSHESSVSLKKKIYDARSTNTKLEKKQFEPKNTSNFVTKKSSSNIANLRVSKAGATHGKLLTRSVFSFFMTMLALIILLTNVIPQLCQRTNPQEFYYTTITSFLPSIVTIIISLSFLLALPSILLTASHPRASRLLCYAKMIAAAAGLISFYTLVILTHMLLYSDDQATPFTPLGLQSILRVVIDHSLDLLFLQAVPTKVFVERRAEVVLLSFGNTRSLFFFCVYFFTFISYLYLLLKTTRDEEEDSEYTIKEFITTALSGLIIGNLINVIPSLRGPDKELIFSEVLTLKTPFMLLILGGILWVVFIALFRSKSPDRYIPPSIGKGSGSFFNS